MEAAVRLNTATKKILLQRLAQIIRSRTFNRRGSNLYARKPASPLGDGRGWLPARAGRCPGRMCRPDQRSLAMGGLARRSQAIQVFLLRPFLFRRSWGPRSSAASPWGERREKEKRKGPLGCLGVCWWGGYSFINVYKRIRGHLPYLSVLISRTVTEGNECSYKETGCSTYLS